jgi:hypothetical protein
MKIVDIVQDRFGDESNLEVSVIIEYEFKNK